MFADSTVHVQKNGRLHQLRHLHGEQAKTFAVLFGSMDRAIALEDRGRKGGEPSDFPKQKPRLLHRGFGVVQRHRKEEEERSVRLRN